MTASSRALKLTIATAVVTALAAVSVAQASAASFHFEGTPSWLKGSQVTQNAFGFNGGVVKGSVAEYASVAAISTASASTITLHPTFASNTGFGQVVSVDTTGCNLVITVSSLSPSTGSASIECSSGPISFHGSTTGCSVSIGAQTLGGPNVSFTSNAVSAFVSDLIVSFQLSGLTYSSTGGACGSSGLNGTLTGSGTVEAFASATFSSLHSISTQP